MKKTIITFILFFCMASLGLAETPNSQPANSPAAAGTLTPAMQRALKARQQQKRQKALKAIGALNEPTTQPESPLISLWAEPKNINDYAKTKTLLAYANELDAKLPSSDPEFLHRALIIFMRAGQPKRVFRTIKLMEQCPTLGEVRCGVPSTLISWGYFPEAKHWFDTFLIPCKHYDESLRFRKWMIEQYGLSGYTAWVREKAEQSRHYFPLPLPREERERIQWPRFYLEELKQQGKLASEIRRMGEQLKKQPDNLALACDYVTACHLLPFKNRPPTEWLEETLQFKTVWENLYFALHPKLEHSSLQLAFMKKSLDCPLTNEDCRKAPSILYYRKAWAPLKPMGRELREWATSSLAFHYKQEGLKERHDVFVRKMAEQWAHTQLDPDYFWDASLEKQTPTSGDYWDAGKSEGITGKRLAENRIKEAYEKNKHSKDYWLGRAIYYRARKEPKYEEEAYVCARIALPKPQDRLDIISEYGEFLVNHKRAAEAEKLYRQEITRFGFNDGYSSFFLNKLLHLRPNDKPMEWDDPLIWDWLEAQKKTNYFYDCYAVLHHLASCKPDKKAFEKKIRRLASQPCSPVMEFVVGNILYLKLGYPEEGLHKMEHAAERQFRKDKNASSQLVGILLSIYRKQKKGEAYWAMLQKLMQIPPFDNNTVHWYGQEALTLAKLGQFDPALQLWEHKTRLTLINLYGLEELAKTPINQPLQSLYRALQKEDPENAHIAKALNILKENEKNK